MGALKAALKGPLGVALCVAALASAGEGLGLFSRVEAASMDWRYRQQREGTVDPRLLMVDVDQPTLDALGWPVPREYFALLLGAAAKAGAKGAIFDVEFMDPAANPVSDAALEASLPLLPVVLAEELAVSAEAEGKGWPEALEAHPPLAALASHATLAHIQVDSAPDGVARRVPLLVRHGDALVPSLGLAGARLLRPGLGAPSLSGTTLALGSVRFPVDARGFVSPDFRPIPAAQRMSLVDLLAQLKADPAALLARLKGKLLVVGYSAASVGDRGPTPLSPNAPLMNVHAQTVDTLVNGRALRVAPPWLNFLLAFLVAWAIAWAPARFSIWVGALLSVGILGAFTVGAGLAFWKGRVALALASPVVAGVAAFAAIQLRVRRKDEEQVRQIRQAFGKYVAPSILNRIVEDPSALNVAGKEAELAILFSDVQGYTSLSNRLPPQQVLSLLRTYLDVMSRILLEHEGTIDKIMGDGILAFFGDPIPSENPSRQAVACGLAMQEAMATLSARWAEEGYGQLKIRVGVATGRVYVGNIGSSDHLEYTVIGPTVNLAARLESNAPAGGVLVAEPTMRACEAHFDFERVTGLTLKGFGTDQEGFVCKGPKGAGAEEGAPTARAGGQGGA